MNKEKTVDKKKKYDLYRHHAWAGSVLLAVLLAIRVFTTSINQMVNELIFIVFGFIIVCYILGALLLTYRYRSGLNQITTDSNTRGNSSQKGVIIDNKEQLKIDKKKAKNEYKQMKKQLKDK